MALTVLTAAESYAFDTLANVKTLLKITTSADDALLTLLINATSDAIRDYTKREFAREEIEETVAGFDSTYLTLTRTPIESVSEVLNDGTPVLDYTVEKPKAGLLFRESGWDWSVGHWWTASPQPAPGTEAPKYKVTYYAGYWLPSFTGAKPATAIDLPASLHLAFLDLLSFWYGQSKQSAVGVDSLTIGDYSVDYSSANQTSGGLATGGMPASVISKLEPWVRIH